jgi:hypothetical protein
MSEYGCVAWVHLQRIYRPIVLCPEIVRLRGLWALARWEEEVFVDERNDER